MPFPVALRASLRPSVIMLALVGLSAAGCSSDTSRFESPFANPFASKPQPEMTGSINSAPPPSGRIESAPLPAPNQATGMLPPPTQPAVMHAGTMPPAASAAPQPARPWDWDGGTAV